MKSKTNKEELQQRDRLRTVNGKNYCAVIYLQFGSFVSQGLT